MAQLSETNYQHHLVPQTLELDVSAYDRIVNIERLDQYLAEKELPLAGCKNRLIREDVARSVIDDQPAILRNGSVPEYHCFVEERLVDVVKTDVYPNDYKALNEFFD